MAGKSISAERLREILSYDPDTGVFVWRITLSNRITAGKIAGASAKIGYLMIGINNVRYYGHRLAWLYVYGSWPTNHIDHIDSDKTNNRISNLREATRSQNMQNMKRARSDNASGFLGVSHHSQANSWCAEIRIPRKKKFLGLFNTPEAAHSAYIQAKRKLHEFGEI